MNPFIEYEKSKVEEKRIRIAKIMGEILDMMEKRNVSISEMSDVIVNLQVQFNRMLLDENDKLKKHEGNTQGKIVAAQPGRITL